MDIPWPQTSQCGRLRGRAVAFQQTVRSVFSETGCYVLHSNQQTSSWLFVDVVPKLCLDTVYTNNKTDSLTIKNKQKQVKHQPEVCHENKTFCIQHEKNK